MSRTTVIQSEAKNPGSFFYLARSFTGEEAGGRRRR